MNKLIGAGVGLALFVGGAISASAATISDPLFSNGDTTIDVSGGSTVNGTFTLQVGSGEVCEVIRTQAAPQAFTDTSVNGVLGYQFGTHTGVSFNVKVSPNTGTYNPMVQCAGIFGGNHSVDGSDNVVVGPQSLGTIRVVANSTGGSSSSNTALEAQIAELTKLVASLTAQINGTGGTPSNSAICIELNKYTAGLYVGSTGSSVVSLQGFLLAKDPNSIPLIRDGQAKFGFYGSQTARAVASYNCTK